MIVLKNIVYGHIKVMETLSEVTKVTPTDKVIPRFQLPFFSLRDVVLVLVFFGLRELVFFFS